MTRLIRSLLLVAVILGALPRSEPAVAVQGGAVVPFWGMNGYFTKRERLATGDNVGLLADTARNGGAQWTREELPWALVEQQRGRYLNVYDSSLKLTASKGFGIIGMLLTTPDWARDRSCANWSSNYWCPPANVADYANWVKWMVKRYDGDGSAANAPGSPRIAAWEIWNEPNDTAQWPDIAPNSNARKLRYGQMLVAAYNAIKSVDPTAIVLTGGTYVYDGGCYSGLCDGFNFFNAPGGVFPQLPAARQAFDVFAIHPYIPTDRPDAPGIPPQITVEGRVRTARAWLDNPAIGRSDAPLWITEMGWCTTGGTCPGGVAVSEDAQANYLTRSLVIAQQNGVQHASWFQLEDAFNDPKREWSYAAILHDYNGTAYPSKPAFNAFHTAAAVIGTATPNGPGPANSHLYRQGADRGDNGVYDYRYTRGTTTIDVLWIPTGTTNVALPVDSSSQLTLVDRDGQLAQLTATNGTVRLNVSERPQFVMQGPVPALTLDTHQLVFLARPQTPAQCAVVHLDNAGGIVNWSATPGAGWLTVAPASGLGAANITVCGNAAGLSSGSYKSDVVVSGDRGAGSQTVAVTLGVSDQLHTTFVPLVHD